MLRTLLAWLRGDGFRAKVSASSDLSDPELDGPDPAWSKPVAVPRKSASIWPDAATITRQSWEELARLFTSGRAPEGLEVGHSLSLAKLRLRSLPAWLIVRGDLDLRQCQRLRRIGAGLAVRGDLRIGGRCREDAPWELLGAWNGSGPAGLFPLGRDPQCPLSALPEGLRVGGSLIVHQCRRLESLPEDLFVGGSIDLQGCSGLTSLPERLIVRGGLRITSAPRLARLPEGLSVGGNLRLTGVRVERLPDGLRVGGDLILDGCSRLTALPGDLQIGGRLRLHRLDALGELPEGLVVPGRLEIIRCPQLAWLPHELRVGTDLIVRQCPGLQALPTGLRVPGMLDLRGCTRLERLGPGSSIGSDLRARPVAFALGLRNCPELHSLPEDLIVNGPIEVAGSGLRGVPKHLAASARFLWRGMTVPAERIGRLLET